MCLLGLCPRSSLSSLVSFIFATALSLFLHSRCSSFSDPARFLQKEAKEADLQRREREFFAVLANRFAFPRSSLSSPLSFRPSPTPCFNKPILSPLSISLFSSLYSAFFLSLASGRSPPLHFAARLMTDRYRAPGYPIDPVSACWFNAIAGTLPLLSSSSSFPRLPYFGPTFTGSFSSRLIFCLFIPLSFQAPVTSFLLPSPFSRSPFSVMLSLLSTFAFLRLSLLPLLQLLLAPLIVFRSRLLERARPALLPQPHPAETHRNYRQDQKAAVCGAPSLSLLLYCSLSIPLSRWCRLLLSFGRQGEHTHTHTHAHTQAPTPSLCRVSLSPSRQDDIRVKDLSFGPNLPQFSNIQVLPPSSTTQTPLNFFFVSSSCPLIPSFSAPLLLFSPRTSINTLNPPG